MDNYRIQAQQAKEIFCRRDLAAIVRKFALRSDEQYLYVDFLCKPYRINRETGDMQRWEEVAWVDGNSHAEVMTLLDILCDSSDERFLSGKRKSMGAFGLMFHQNLLEEQRDVWAERFDRAPDAFASACECIGGVRVSGGDMAYSFPLCDGLCAELQFWRGDEEFPARIRWLWDENATMYLKYETMYYAVGLILRQISEHFAG